MNSNAPSPLLVSPLLSWPLVIGLGAALAMGLSQVWDLDGRWFYVVVTAIVLVLVGLCFIRQMANFLTIAFLFALPLASFTKWFGLEPFPELVAHAVPYSGGFGLGIVDFIVLGMFAVWLMRILVSKTEPPPRFSLIDFLVILNIVAYIISIPGTKSPLLGGFAVYYLCVHALLYLVVSRTLRADHLKWLLIAFVVAVLIEAAIGFVQYRYGILAGLALDKGKGGEDLDFQYLVPGMEDTTRATGTLYDSHALGTFVSMVGMFLFSLFFSPKVSRMARAALGAAFLLAMGTAVISFSRSAWLSCACGLAVLVVISIYYWREWRMLPSFFVMGVLLLPFLPWATDVILERFANAPSKIMSVRAEGYLIALDIWRSHPILGYGVGNYMYALDLFNNKFAEELPVHNAPLWILAESGVIGLAAFASLVVVVMKRLWHHTLRGPDPLRRYVAGAFAAMVVYLLDSMSNPLFRDLVLFKMFWLIVAFTFALPRITQAFESRPAKTVTTES